MTSDGCFREARITGTIVGVTPNRTQETTMTRTLGIDSGARGLFPGTAGQ